MIKALLLATGIGYLASWVVHGKLIKRIQNTRYYINTGHYGIRQAWRLSEHTL